MKPEEVELKKKKWLSISSSQTDISLGPQIQASENPT